MQQRTLGVAIHGAGVVARAHGASWKKNRNVRIVSVTSRRCEAARRFVEELSLDCRTGDDVESGLRSTRVFLCGSSQTQPQLLPR